MKKYSPLVLFKNLLSKSGLISLFELSPPASLEVFFKFVILFKFFTGLAFSKLLALKLTGYGLAIPFIGTELQ